MNSILLILQFYFICQANSNLIHHWSFNGNLYSDEIGIAHLYDGVNVSLTQDRFGKYNSALRLNNGYMRIPSGVYFAGDFSVMAWVKLNKARHFARIVEFGNGPYADNIELSFRETTNYIHVKTWFKTNTKGFLDSSSPLKVDHWTHVAAVLSGGAAKLYFNGIQVAIGSQYLPRNVTRNLNFIGKGNFAGDESVDASFDEIKVFDKALDEYSIKDEADLDESEGLIHYWSFNDNNMTRDEAGDAHLYEHKNAFLADDRFGKPRSALLINNGQIRIPPGVYFSGDFTFMVWVKFNQRLASLFSFGHSRRNLNMFCDISKVLIIDRLRNKLSFNITNCFVSMLNKNLISTNSEFKLNQWIHLALVLRNDSLKFYLNNTLNGHQPFEMIRNEYFDSNFIGKQNDLVLYNYSITYDEIKMFDRPLSDYELRKQTGFHENGLLHYWSFDDTYKDEIGGANLFDGINEAPTENRFEEPRTAIRFREGFLKVPPGSYFPSEQFTITAWVKFYSVSNFVRIIDFGNGANSNNIIISVGYEGSSYVCFWVFDNPKHGWLKSSTTLKLNTWIHVAVVLKGTWASIYLNGILDSSGDVLKPKQETRRSNFIGKSNWGHDANADASFDEIKLFNRALFIEEIIEESKSNNVSANVTNNVKKIDLNGLINEWSFNGNLYHDEINSDDLSDANNVHLTEDRHGKLNSAIQLENGFMKAPSNIYFTNAFTVTVWFKLNSLRYNSRLTDFGDGISDNIVIGFDELTSHLVVQIYDESYKSEIISKSVVNLNVWTYLAVVFNQGKAEIYLNGSCDTTGFLYIPRSVKRFSNYIGKSNWASNQNIHACLDELKIFNRALDSSEINQELFTVQVKEPTNYTASVLIGGFTVTGFLAVGIIIAIKFEKLKELANKQINMLRSISLLE